MGYTRTWAETRNAIATDLEAACGGDWGLIEGETAATLTRTLRDMGGCLPYSTADVQRFIDDRTGEE